MDDIKNSFKTKIENILNEYEKVHEIFNEKFILDKTQVDYKRTKEQPSSIKEIVKLFKTIHENIIKFFNGIKIDNLKPSIIQQYEDIKKIIKTYETYNNNINIQINYPNNEIKLEEQTQKKLFLLYNKFMKSYEKSNKELISRFNYFLNLFKTLFEKLKKLSKTIDDNRRNFEETGEFLKNLKDENPKVMKGKNNIYNSYINIVVEFKMFDEFFFEIKKKKESWETDDIFNRITNYKNNLNTEIDKFKNEFQEIEKYFPKININIDVLNKIKTDLINNMERFQNYTIKNTSEIIFENKMRGDILIILDTTNSMGKYLKILQKKLDFIIEQIKQKCPLSIIYLGFIGYKDFSDLELGDDYTDLELTLNYNNIYNNIKDLEVDGGDDIPEDVAGAFEMALNKNWGTGQKIAFLITDAPCHGTRYHDLDQKKQNYIDKYPKGFYEGDNEEFRRRDIDELVKDLAQKNISLICFDILKITEKMFDEFKTIYDKEGKKELFSVEKKDLEKIIINKSSELINKENEIIEVLKNKFLQNQ